MNDTTSIDTNIGMIFDHNTQINRDPFKSAIANLDYQFATIVTNDMANLPHYYL